MPQSFLPRAGAALMVVAILGSCKSTEPIGPDKTVALIEVSPKTARMYALGDSTKFTALLTTEAGTSGAGIEVGWIARDNSLLSVNSQGVAKSLKKGGSTYVVATAGGKSDSALVELPETPCSTVAPTSLLVGEVAVNIGPDGFCAANTEGAEYTLVISDTSLSSLGSVSVEATGYALGAPPATPAPALASRTAAARFSTNGIMRRRDLLAERSVRLEERALASRSAVAARRWYGQRGQRASRAIVVPEVGDLMTINVNLTSGCSSAQSPRKDISARVAAVSERAIVLNDPENPPGGYSDADYVRYAALFDSLIYALGTENFGLPTDLDDNGRIVMLFTRAINERSAAGGESYVAGLTHSRDLFPVEDCAGSNLREMFYLLVPDPEGVVNGNELFTREFVENVTSTTIVHEFQHMINFSRRMYVLPPPVTPEVVWLSEGLSHIAEELLYHRVSGRPTRSNIGLSQVFQSEAQVQEFVEYMLSDFILYDAYALAVANTSPFRQDDAVETRGATWTFLRYAADQLGPSDGDLWYRLVNSGQAGMTNLQAGLGVSGAVLQGMLRDFAISVYADDHVTSIADKYTQPSWDMRTLYQLFTCYPTCHLSLPGTALTDNTVAAATLKSGGFTLYRFKAASGADALVRVTGTSGAVLPSPIALSVIRTK